MLAGTLRLAACVTAALFGVAGGAAHAQVPPASELLARAVAYHDPDGRWLTGAHRLVLDESRPDGRSRQTAIVVDPSRGRFHLTSERAGALIDVTVDGDDVDVSVNGSREISADDIEAHRLTPDGVRRTRNYYIYLYGLPMKLDDPGTHLDPAATERTFEGRPVYALRVTYEPEVGREFWDFYLDRSSGALVGYQFYREGKPTEGEYIVLEGEVTADGIRLPKARTWYRTHDRSKLGTDTIASFTKDEP